MTETQVNAPAGQTRGREYVQSFLFSVKIDSPLARLHMVTKLIVTIFMSFLVVELIATDDPDPISTVLIIALAFYALYLGGVLKWLFSSYLVVLFPALIGMMIPWIFFNSDPGENVWIQFQLYSGQIRLGLSLGLAIFVLVVVAWYAIRKEFFLGIVIGLVLSLVIPPLFKSPALVFAEFDFFRPIPVVVTSRNIFLALTKSMGYGAMMFTSLMLVMTSRDIELVGAMRQFRFPYVVNFFVSTMLRSLSLALHDYETIKQAQVARGITLKKRNLFQILVDYARMAVPVVATMLRRSSEVGDAVMVRGFSLKSDNPTEFHEAKSFHLMDFVLLGVTLLVTVAVFVFDINITRMLGVTL
jgi:energy-coupling factor transporter transmembrane protein EcfT